MTLMQCTECKSQISDKADACPNCGNPINQKNAENSIQTIQETGKSLKLHYILSISLWLIGFFTAMLSERKSLLFYTGIAIFAIGVLWFLITKFRMWWNHR